MKDNYWKPLSYEESRLFPLKLQGRRRAAVIFPGDYRAGMSSLAFHGLFRIISNQTDWVAERYFTQAPSKYTCDNGFLMRDCDIWIFTVSYELQYLQIASFLKESGIPPRPEDRSHMHPLIIAGGAVTYSNAYPLSGVADLVFSGDEDGRISSFSQIFEKFSSHAQIWEYYADDPHVLTPVDKVSKTPVYSSEKTPWHSSFISSDTEFSGMFLVELSRGCNFSCPFCAAGNSFGEFRSFCRNRILETVRIYPEIKKIGFVAATPTDHPEFTDIVNELAGYELSFSSLRLDSLPEWFFHSGYFGNQKSVTVGLESGSERLRKLIGKNVSEDLLIDRLEKIYSCGIRNLKLYAMYGLPEETEDDLFELAAVCEKICRIWRSGRVSVSLNAFVPLPDTPWGNYNFDISALRRKEKNLMSIMRRMKRVETEFESLKKQHLQYLYSRGNRAVITDLC